MDEAEMDRVRELQVAELKGDDGDCALAYAWHRLSAYGMTEVSVGDWMVTENSWGCVAR